MARTDKKKAARQSLRDKIRQRAKEKKNSRSGSNAIRLPDGKKFLDVKKGTMFLDILPYEVTATNHPEQNKGELWYERTYFQHSNIGAENKKYICPRKTLKKPCPICEQRDEFMKDYDANKDLIKDLRPSERQIFNVINLDKDSDGVQVFDVSNYLFGEKLEKEINEDEDYGCFVDLEDGLTLKVRFDENNSFANPFYEADRIDFKIRDDYPESILDEVVDLDTCLNVLTYDELEKIFLELDEPAEEQEQEEEQEDPPARSSRRSAAEDKDEEEKPATRSRRQPAEEQEEESAEEEKPVRRRGRRESEPEEDSCPENAVWGEECDSLDACQTCDLWEKCKDEQDRLAAEKKPAGRRRR